MNYRISRCADADIECICDYIAADNPAAAERLDQRIHTTIQTLAEFPDMGHHRPDVQDRRYYFWAVGNYVIAYRIENNALVVVRVLHGARNFRRLFRRPE